MNNYAVYLRKSRKDMELEALGEGETLARHRKALQELAERQGLHIDKYYEEMVSGESIADRPQVQRLLNDVCSGMYTGVLVMEIERLARGNTRDQGEVAEAFAMSKTLIVTPSKTYDPTNEFDEEYFEFGLFMSRREYKTIRRRMQRGLIASVKEGNYVGSLPPYGYDIVRINKKERTLTPNDQAQNVKMIFDWYVNERLNPGAIARRLTALGIPTKTGRPEWNRATIKDILQNNLYCGQVRWYRRKTSKEMDDGGIRKRKRRLSPDEYIVVPGKHPPLISQETFDAAQELFVGTAPVKAGTTLANPLAGLIFCKRCGKSIAYASYASKAGNVAPRMVHRESVKCKVKSASYDAVQEALLQALRAYIADFEFLSTNEAELQQARNHAALIASMEKELSALETQRASLFDYLERKLYTEAEFLERKAVLTSKIEAQMTAIAAAKDSAPVTVDYTEKIIKFREVIAVIESSTTTAKQKNDLLKQVVKRIEYDCKDLGRNKGGDVLLDVYLKD